jgi:hypothetical protein
MAIINEKIGRYFGVSAIAYLESERYAMHIWLDIALITLVPSLFFIVL